MQYKLPKDILLQTYGKNIELQYRSNSSCLISLSPELEDIYSISNKERFPLWFKINGMSNGSGGSSTQKTSNLYFTVDTFYAETSSDTSTVSQYSLGVSNSWFQRSYIDTSYTNLAESDMFTSVANSSDSGFYIRQQNYTSLLGNEKFLHIYMDVTSGEPQTYNSNTIRSRNTDLNIITDGSAYTGDINLTSNKNILLDAYNRIELKATPYTSQSSRIDFTYSALDYWDIDTYNYHGDNIFNFGTNNIFYYQSSSSSSFRFLSTERHSGSMPLITLGSAESDDSSEQHILIRSSMMEMNATSTDSTHSIYLHAGNYNSSTDTYDAEIIMGTSGVEITGLALDGLVTPPQFNNLDSGEPEVTQFSGELTLNKGTIFQLIIHFYCSDFSTVLQRVVFAGKTFSDVQSVLSDLVNTTNISNVYYGIAISTGRVSSNNALPLFNILKGSSYGTNPTESNFLNGLDAILMDSFAIAQSTYSISGDSFIRVSCLVRKKMVLTLTAGGAVTNPSAEIIAGPREY